MFHDEGERMQVRKTEEDFLQTHKPLKKPCITRNVCCLWKLPDRLHDAALHWTLTWVRSLKKWGKQVLISVCSFIISYNDFLLIWERGRETSTSCSPYSCIHWVTLVCARTGDPTHNNLMVSGWCANQPSYLARASVCSSSEFSSTRTSSCGCV